MGYASHSVHSITAQPPGSRGVLIELTLPIAYDYQYEGLPHYSDKVGSELYERCVPTVLTVLARHNLPLVHAFPLPRLNADGSVARACGLYIPVARLSARVVMELRRELGLAVPGLTVTSGSSVVSGPVAQEVGKLARGEAARPAAHAVDDDPEYATAHGG
jgi:hypothetical protein